MKVFLHVCFDAKRRAIFKKNCFYDWSGFVGSMLLKEKKNYNYFYES